MICSPLDISTDQKTKERNDTLRRKRLPNENELRIVVAVGMGIVKVRKEIIS